MEHPAHEEGEGNLPRALRDRAELLELLEQPRQARQEPLDPQERQLVPVQGRPQPVGEQRQLARLVWL